jgi:ABC-type phosphate transport system substrate-binding protein
MKKIKNILGLLLISVLAVCGNAMAQDKSADLAIVVNPACTMENVTSAELVKIFKAEKAKNLDGAKYVIVLRDAGSPERNAALKGIYQMTDGEYEKFFLQATFAGTVQAAPKALSSAASVKSLVAGAPGGIGYVRGSDADGSVKVLKIDGKLPGDAGYPLKIN